jgi:hypothetical protein
MNEIEAFTREAARMRGIDPDVAVRAFETEGGVTEPARLGDFSGPPWYSGKSWWPPQLHYGGVGPQPWQDYRAFGNTAGMGNGFTALTGWAPGDPRAWRDAIRYALNRVKTGGWSPWYGPATIGITGFTGVDRSAPWNAESETWDYETGGGSVPKITFNRDEPAIAQNDPWSCAPTSTRWALTALGRHPSESWLEGQIQADGVVSQELGLLDASGAGLAHWITAQYGEFGYSASNEPSVTFDAVAREAGPYPLLLGGRAWNHWSGVRGYDQARDLLLLANPSSGWKGVGQVMDRSQFAALGPFSMVRVTHPDLLAPSTPATDCTALKAEVEALRAKVAAALQALQAA